jgi:hypothetical protein
MGSTFFRTSYRGKTLSEAYTDAVEHHEDEYGQDPYNGTISTTHGVMDKTKDYKASGKSLEDYIEMQSDILEKRECAAICLEEPKGNTNKIKTHVEHIVTPGTKKWILKYMVYAGFEDKFVGGFDNKSDAVKAARAYTEKTQVSTYVHMEKVLSAGSRTVAKVTYKRATAEKDGRWIFFGWAAE